MAQIEEPLPWGRSSATEVVLEGLVAERLLPLNTNPSWPVWIPPRPWGSVVGGSENLPHSMR